MAREHEEHLARALKHVIRASDYSARAIERELGMSGGYVSRLTSGRLELKMSNLFDILDVLGLTPNEFFSIAFPLRPGEASSLMKRLRELSPPPEPAGGRSVEPDAGDGEMERKVMDALRKVLSETETGSRKA